MKRLAVLAALLATPAFADALLATPAFADVERREAEGGVAAVMDRLEAAVIEAGATVFGRVDHGAGAASAGLELAESELLLFGNPALGTPAMQADPLAGLFLPLKILVYADAEGRTFVAYEEVEETFDDLEIDDNAPFLEQMENALERFAEAAAG